MAALQPAPALPAGVACYAAAGTLAAWHGLLADKLVGDGLVPLDSALGRHRDPARALHVPKAQQWVGHETGHLQLLNQPELYAQLLAWLGGPAPPAAHGCPRRPKTVQGSGNCISFSMKRSRSARCTSAIGAAICDAATT